MKEKGLITGKINKRHSKNNQNEKNPNENVLYSE